MKQILLIMIGLSRLLSADFSRDTNGIVIDNTTGLEWQDDAIGAKVTWQNSIDICDELILGGHEDWRLPNLNELTSLVDDTQYNPSIDSVLKNTASNYYWSSSTPANNSYTAWIVNFKSGYQRYYNKNSNYFVRCVRAGQ